MQRTPENWQRCTGRRGNDNQDSRAARPSTDAAQARQPPAPEPELIWEWVKMYGLPPA